MNIFYLDPNPVSCAEYHYDTHVVKMILESAQLLSTAHHLCGEGGPYKLTHQNHPSAIWTRENSNHYSWLYCLMLALGKEYEYRYGRIHKTIKDHADTLWKAPSALKAGKWQDPPLAMPDHCKKETVVESYRNYYLTEKLNLMKYTKREIPQWIRSKVNMIAYT